MINVAFLGAFTALTSTISPLIVPLASLAILAFAFALMLFPLTGGKNPFNCPHEAPWAGRLPSGYYQRSPTPYAVQAGIRGMATESERRSQIAATDAGMQRQFVGLLPAALAVVCIPK